ncbi:hypothetical protein V2G26_018223 [Clonostachys chloroleuca]
MTKSPKFSALPPLARYALFERAAASLVACAWPDVIRYVFPLVASQQTDYEHSLSALHPSSNRPLGSITSAPCNATLPTPLTPT